jgi:hypothetical protein
VHVKRTAGRSLRARRVLVTKNVLWSVPGAMRFPGYAAIAVLALATGRGHAAPSGADVIAAARATADRVTDRSMRVRMDLIAPGGDTRSRSLLGYEKRVPEGHKVLWIFEAPADVAGTSFLALPQPGAPDQLWLYLPAQRRVRQVAAQLRRERFQGSHFTYEDLTAIFFFDYGGDHRLVETRACGDATCDVVETRLEPGRFAYSRLVTSIRQDTHLPDRIQFFDTALTKEMHVLRVADVDGMPTVLQLEMETPGDGYRTRLEYSDVKPNAGLDDGLFTVEQLAHGR